MKELASLELFAVSELYVTHEPVPHPRKWVGLTNEEIGGLTVFDGLHHVSTPLLAEFIKSIEANS